MHGSGETQSTFFFCSVILFFNTSDGRETFFFFFEGKIQTPGGSSCDFIVQLPPARSAILFQLDVFSRRKWWIKIRNEWNPRKIWPFLREPGIESGWNLQIWTKLDEKYKELLDELTHITSQTHNPKANASRPNRRLWKVSSSNSNTSWWIAREVSPCPSFRYGNLRTLSPDVARPINDVSSKVEVVFEVWPIYRGTTHLFCIYFVRFSFCLLLKGR